MKPAALIVGLLLSACQGKALPDPAEEARRIEAVFAQVCGTEAVNVDAIHARARAAGERLYEAEAVTMYRMRPPANGLVVSVVDGLEQCDAAPSNPVMPEPIAAQLAANLARAGGVEVEPPGTLAPNLKDCRSYQFGETIRSACIIDFTPHGVAPALVLSKPSAPTF